MKTEPIMPKYQSFLTDESKVTGFAEEIIFPTDLSDICLALQYANENGKKVTVQGSRTGIVGGAVPRSGIVLNLSKMNRILGSRNDENSCYLKVQAGVTLKQIETKVNSKGFFFPPNPTEDTATIGGVFSSNAAGSNCLIYGDSSKYISELSFVTTKGELWSIKRGEYVFVNNKCNLPNGAEIKIPTGLPHSPIKIFSEGMDLIDFLSGTEGILGVAVEFELELLPLPKEIWGVVYFFNELEQAIDFSRKLLDWKAQDENASLMATEFYDKGTLKLLNDSRQSNILLKSLPQFPQNACTAIYTELCGDNSDIVETSLMEHLNLFLEVGGAEEDTWAESGTSSIKRFRDMRHAVPSIINEMINLDNKNDYKRWETDFSGCPEMFEDYLNLYYKALENNELNGLIYGHILNNRMHLALLPENTEQESLCNSVMQQLDEKVMQKQGFLITENGVGILKQSLVRKFMPKAVTELIEIILHTFDPNKCMKYSMKEE